YTKPWHLPGFAPTEYTDRDGSDDDAYWLYPNYVKPFRSYTCPATQNTVRPDTYNVPFSTETYVYDLLDNAKNKKANGTSYEIFGTMAQLSANGATISLKKTD